jgi:hypothetical protein
MPQVTVNGTVYHITAPAAPAPAPGAVPVAGPQVLGLSRGIATELVNTGQTSAVAAIAGDIVVGNQQDGISTISGWITSGRLQVWM